MLVLVCSPHYSIFNGLRITAFRSNLVEKREEKNNNFVSFELKLLV